MKSVNLITSVVGTLWPVVTDLWEAWGIQLLVTAGLACRIALAILGRWRRYMTSISLRYIILAAYLLSSYIATIAIGKLTVIQINHPDRPDYITELKGLLAPLLLMQLGNPDSITAYSVEDNRLSVRQMLNMLVTVVFVVWILIRCWDSSSPVPLLYFPLFVTGFIESAGSVWALKSVYWERSSILAKDIFDTKAVAKFFDERAPHEVPGWVMKQNIILKAYYRFDCLKPHIINWLYHPDWLANSRLIVDPDLAFITTEIELGFMYDALYTKKPILCKRLGLISRFISFLCLVSALCRFAIIFQDAFLIDRYVGYTYALLMGVTALEGYQIVLQPFSAWAIAVMSQHQSNPLVSTRLLNFVVELYMKRKRWSNSIGQLGLLDPRLYNEWPWRTRRILKLVGMKEVTLRRYLIHSRLKIRPSLKTLLVESIEKLEKLRCQKPFSKRGEWMLEVHKLGDDQVLKKYISKFTFDKSIIIWHMATKICLFSAPEKSQYCEGSELLSNYMMYLLALRPYTLSLTTSDITLEHARAILKPFLRYRDHDEALRILSSTEEIVLEPHLDPKEETIITTKWHVLIDAKELAATLKDKENMWQIISGIWVEMLCYAAYSCQVYHHAKLLRRGGELITHVWLLLMHETDKYSHAPKANATKETKGKARSES
ncbi:uncharacterized protein LOC115736037 [Rhodamnia argentea]|uniref:Uncharacterized protein LOC115736037 n=1 Tax=Rhodamnia argentea TaxID=178133 RepID=A0A8B8NLM1_9MYRT|nr:uncharacterized protein LOC115736037 [Rhodamnia argentea]XP_048134294.1 uncharacterized protein LOC115736037 [Rhodamnia argentea]